MKITHGAIFRAKLKTEEIIFSDSPIYLSRIEPGLICRKETLASSEFREKEEEVQLPFAIAFANMVFPVPGFPNNNIPGGQLISFLFSD